MPHRQNTTHVSYRLLPGSAPVALRARARVRHPPPRGPRRRAPGAVTVRATEPPALEVTSRDERFPPLRSRLAASPGSRSPGAADARHRLPRSKRARGYDWRGTLRSLGSFEVDLGARRRAHVRRLDRRVGRDRGALDPRRRCTLRRAAPAPADRAADPRAARAASAPSWCWRPISSSSRPRTATAGRGARRRAAGRRARARSSPAIPGSPTGAATR